jgi:hypothetical protein
MQPKTIYLGLCILGVVLPYAFFLPFVLEHGFDIPLMVREVFVNQVSSSFGMDVLVSSFVVCALVFFEGRRAGVRHRWAPLLALIPFGVALALPLFLYLRERALEARAN